MVPFVLAAFLLSFSFQSCQKDEVATQSNVLLKSAMAPNESVNLVYPEDDINAGEDFDITFSSTCGKIMLERGYVHGDLTGTDEFGNPIYEKVYAGLTCDAENLYWESIGTDEFTSCAGKTITENWSEVGTYVYRAKWNQTKVKTSDCQSCQSFKGNQFECFAVTVVEANFGTFTDARDSKEYSWVKIGNQVWMAENLAFKTVSRSWPYNNDEANVAEYGRLYSWSGANPDKLSNNNVPSGIKGVCPDGWHLPSYAEWGILETSLGGAGVAGGKMKATGYGLWFPPNTGATNESGFNGLPAGVNLISHFQSKGNYGYWWSCTKSDSYSAYTRYVDQYSGVLSEQGFSLDYGFSVRCVKD